MHSSTQAGTCCPDNDLNLCKIEVGSFFAVRKFVLMHEYGHAVAHRITGSGSWDNGSNDCSLGGGGYTFTSREYMGCVANEGFADFVSTSVFNDPDWNALYYRGEEFWMTDDWHPCDTTITVATQASALHTAKARAKAGCARGGATLRA